MIDLEGDDGESLSRSAIGAPTVKEDPDLPPQLDRDESAHWSRRLGVKLLQRVQRSGLEDIQLVDLSEGVVQFRFVIRSRDLLGSCVKEVAQTALSRRPQDSGGKCFKFIDAKARKKILIYAHGRPACLACRNFG